MAARRVEPLTQDGRDGPSPAIRHAGAAPPDNRPPDTCRASLTGPRSAYQARRGPRACSRRPYSRPHISVYTESAGNDWIAELSMPNRTAQY